MTCTKAFVELHRLLNRTPDAAKARVALAVLEAQHEPKKVFLVYQAGIANVFEVECFNLAPGDKRKRLLQADFRTCEAFAQGCGAMGAIVRTAACNMAGDIAQSRWTEDLDAQPFSDKFNPVKLN